MPAPLTSLGVPGENEPDFGFTGASQILGNHGDRDQQVGKMLATLLGLGSRRGLVENRRVDAAIGRLTGEFDAQAGAFREENDTLRRASRADLSDATADQARQRSRAFRAERGGRGFSRHSGISARQEFDIDRDRVRQNRIGNREIEQAIANRSTAERHNRLAFAGGPLFQGLTTSPSLAEEDTLGSGLNTILGLKAIDASERASKRASTDSKIGGILGGLGSLFGGIF